MPALHLLSKASLTQFALTNGAWAVLVSVMIESTGLPMQSESIPAAVAALASCSDPHAPEILAVILAAIAGAVLGDNLGYAIGRGAGPAILERFGPSIGLRPPRQRLGRYLFERYGGRIVVVARFVSVLRTAVSLLAGTAHLPRSRFLLCNAFGAVVWAGLVGGGAYLLGERIRAWSWPVSLGLLAVVTGALVVGLVLLRRKEAFLRAEADRMLLRDAVVPDRR